MNYTNIAKLRTKQVLFYSYIQQLPYTIIYIANVATPQIVEGGFLLSVNALPLKVFLNFYLT